MSYDTIHVMCCACHAAKWWGFGLHKFWASKNQVQQGKHWELASVLKSTVLNISFSSKPLGVIVIHSSDLLPACLCTSYFHHPLCHFPCFLGKHATCIVFLLSALSFFLTCLDVTFFCWDCKIGLSHPWLSWWQSQQLFYHKHWTDTLMCWPGMNDTGIIAWGLIDEDFTISVECFMKFASKVPLHCSDNAPATVTSSTKLLLARHSKMNRLMIPMLIIWLLFPRLSWACRHWALHILNGVIHL
jgi:hypothetical protein